MSKIYACLWVVVLSTLATSGMILPPDLKRIMANVNSLDTFMTAFNLGNITLQPPPPRKQQNGWESLLNKKSTQNAKLKTVAVGRTRVVSFFDDTSPPIALDDAPCKPYPTVIEVPQPSHHQGFHYPFNVMMHRCAGSCSTKPRVQECVATATENISLLSFLVSWNSPSASKNQLRPSHRIMPIVNHTQCGCQCITKPSDCDPSTQVFSQDKCRCECKARSRPCPAYHRWDRVR
ncbi:uncharacterized protein LOC116298792 isoform X2 [Actinia tenebrosa]|nr:uncharacterized protein LOC116298792 isoform X2 [Actinia tenebrosa]